MSDEQYIDALRLTNQQRLEIIAKLKQRALAPPLADLRLSERRQFYQSKVIVEMFHPGGTRMHYRVQAVNLSTMGIGFLHGNFCYTGTPVIAHVTSLNNKRVQIRGKVVRCQFLEGRIHEIGVMFTEPIHLDQFIEDASTASDSFDITGSKITRLRGKVLYIESTVDNRELMGFLTDQMGVELTSVDSLEMGCQRIDDQQFDLVIVDLSMDNQAAKTLRERNYNGPIVGASVREDMPPENLAEEYHCKDILVMPFSQESLTVLLDKYLMRDTLTDSNTKPLISQQWRNPQMRPVITDYLKRLESTIQQLDSLFKQGDLVALRRLTYELKSSAGGYGFGPISELAGLILEMIDAEIEQAEMKEQVKNLIELCSSACIGNRKPNL